MERDTEWDVERDNDIEIEIDGERDRLGNGKK